MIPARKRTDKTATNGGAASASDLPAEAAPPAKRLDPASILAAQADEMGALQARLAPYRGDISREEALKSALRAAFAADAPEQACEARRARFIALLGAKGFERSVDVAALSARIGWKAVLPLAKVALNALTRLTDPPLVAAGQASIVSAQTGPRPLQVFAIKAAQAAESKAPRKGARK